MSPALRLRTLFFSALIVAAAGTTAHASNPTSTYVVPTKVEFFPDQANATKVVIHGAFFLWQNGGAYSAPKCGYMYLSCVPGQEAMCRMQWNEIAAQIKLPYV